jgi:hypothetical protein
MPASVANPEARPWLALREAISSMSGPGVAVSARQATAKSANVERSGIGQPCHGGLLTVGAARLWNISARTELLIVAASRARD